MDFSGGVPGPAWTPEMRAMMEKVLPRDVTALVGSLIPMLSSQALIYLGRVDHPLHGRKMRDLSQAQLAVECVAALLEKLEPRLDTTERTHLRQMLTELQIQYAKAREEGP